MNRQRRRWRSEPRSKLRRKAFGSLMAVALVTLGLTVAPSGSAAAATRPAAPFDFNGDGYADLAVGAPGESLHGVAGAGLVEVLYGSSTGLVAQRSQAWTRDTPGVKGVVAEQERFGSSTASGDFDHDGYADLAIGATGKTHGSVTVLFGSRSGLTARDQMFVSADLGVSEGWGSALVAGDVNGDGSADLAISATGSESTANRSAVDVLYGGARGLRVDGATRITKASPGLAGDNSFPVAFGDRLASGDLNGDGFADLALGTRRVSGPGSGAYVLYGSGGGITTAGSQFFSYATPGLAPANTRFTELGDDVGIGDFDADGYADLVLADFDGGPPGSTDCAEHAACPGAVLVLRGSAAGVTTAKKQLWYQDAPGIPGASEGGDVFGWAVATGDVNGDGHADLAVGVVGEDVGATLDAGAVNIIYGGATGLTSAGAQIWTQGSPGIKGRAEASDYFGRYLRVGSFGHGAAADLAVSGDGEDVGSLAEAGEVNVLYGSPHGVTTSDQLWSQNSPGIAGTAETGDSFGVL